MDRQTDRALDHAVDSTAARATGEGRARPAADRGRDPGARSADRRGGGGGSDAGWSGGGAAFVNYDFTPGDVPLFVEDFARETVGDFPRRLTLRGGNGEVAEWNGGRWLRLTAGSAFEIPLRGPLPPRFTLEMDVAPAVDAINAVEVLFGADVPGRWQPLDASRETVLTLERVAGGDAVAVWATGGGVEAGARTRAAFRGGRPVTLRALVDGRYLKAYADGERLANVPNATLTRARRILVRVNANEDSPAYLTNIRVMAGGRRLYDALAERGRVATQGVLFATGSDQIRAESKPTLDEMGAMLGEHPDLRLTIEGHTDNAGDPAANQALSERRAQAVRQALVSRYGVDGDRLQARGYGAAKPAAPNATPEGRQQNRRVELVRQ